MPSVRNLGSTLRKVNSNFNLSNDGEVASRGDGSDLRLNEDIIPFSSVKRIGGGKSNFTIGKSRMDLPLN